MIERLDRDKLKAMTLQELTDKYAYVREFFTSMSMAYPTKQQDKTIDTVFHSFEEYELEQKGIDKELLYELFMDFLDSMLEHAAKEEVQVKSVTILGGHNKFGILETIEVTLSIGDVLSIVGRTGSGKSRLLADIEWLAQRDTPTGRQILINGEVPDPEWRFSIEHKLVAQLSQNMNFVMDLTTEEFIRMHAESRMIKDNIDEKIVTILKEANRLAGEEIYKDTPVTALSGGQSRALMIADTAYLSSSPIVLIDEIENAGIDRRTAVNLLIQREKIVIIATHDPVLALYADRRLVIQNGGMYKLIDTSEGEKQKRIELEELNTRLLAYRDQLKMGEILA
jgi:ABC-type lipoprotein export system ATPase subunit